MKDVLIVMIMNKESIRITEENECFSREHQEDYYLIG